jgi:hypothetical protein
MNTEITLVLDVATEMKKMKPKPTLLILALVYFILALWIIAEKY